MGNSKTEMQIVSQYAHSVLVLYLLFITVNIIIIIIFTLGYSLFTLTHLHSSVITVLYIL